jgi:hypothetical protein
VQVVVECSFCAVLRCSMPSRSHGSNALEQRKKRCIYGYGAELAAVKCSCERCVSARVQRQRRPGGCTKISYGVDRPSSSLRIAGAVAMEGRSSGGSEPRWVMIGAGKGSGVGEEGLR